MHISPYIQKTSYAMLSIGFGILTVERFLKVAELANELFTCHNSQRCQMPVFETIKESAVVIASAYTSFKLGQNAMPQNERGYTPRMLRPLALPKSIKPDEELVAFHPGTQALGEQKANAEKVYVYDTLESAILEKKEI